MLIYPRGAIAMFDYVAMGDRMFSARTRKSIKQKEMCKLLGVSQTTYSGFETGTRKIDIDQLYLLAKTLEVPVGWLLGIDSTSGLNDMELLKVEEYKKFIKSQRFN
jgi:transcriptional regulator with XRE-family HTH domain